MESGVFFFLVEQFLGNGHDFFFFLKEHLQRKYPSEHKSGKNSMCFLSCIPFFSRRCSKNKWFHTNLINSEELQSTQTNPSEEIGRIRLSLWEMVSVNLSNHIG